MQHQAALNYTAPYLNSSAFAQQHGKPFMVMEVKISLRRLEALVDTRDLV
jgi:hypothetical protein